MKLNIIVNKDRTLGIPWLYKAIFCLFLTSSAYSDDVTNRPVDFVAFFKQAISSPPDIEKCVVKRTSLRDFSFLPPSASKSLGSNSFQYFEVALSKTNFYLRYISDPDQPAASNHLDSVVARSESSIYAIGGHGVTYGVGSNALVRGTDVNFGMARQILCMGAGEIKPETVNWNGNEFTAKNVLGKDVYGSLQVSNNLPFRMELSLGGSPLPYEAIEYTYPTSVDSFTGYPAKILIYYKSVNGLKPLAMIEFRSLQLATQRLSASFFSETRFASRIAYTNVYSNSDFYASNIKTKQLVKDNSYQNSGGFTNSNSHAVIYCCLIFTTLLPAISLVIWSVRKTKTKNKTDYKI